MDTLHCVGGTPLIESTTLPDERVATAGPGDRPFNQTDISLASRIGIVGLGYVGLPTALAFLDARYQVVGFDISAERLQAVRDGQVDLLPQDHSRLRRYSNSPEFVTTREPADLNACDVVLICVPTPVDEHQVPDLRALRSACAMATDNARCGQLILLTSTTYVGTTRQLLVQPLERRGFQIGRDVFVAFAPERIDPGNSAHHQMATPRIVGGATNDCTARAVKALEQVAPSVHQVSSIELAEMTKLVENTFRAVNIALANEFADICRDLQLDAKEVIDAAATKPYGFMAFYPGPGVGGHCIPCDPHYLLWQLRAGGRDAPIIDTAMTAIAQRPRRVIERVRELLGDNNSSIRNARILLVGAAYKPGVADVRESPALYILSLLSKSGAEVSYTDEYVPTLEIRGKLIHSETQPQEKHWDAVVVHTLHPGTDLTWIDEVTPILDATYNLSKSPGVQSL